MARSPLLTARLVTAATVQLEARVHLSQVNQPNRDEDAHNDADGHHSKHEFCSPASFNVVARHVGSVAKP